MKFVLLLAALCAASTMAVRLVDIHESSEVSRVVEPHLRAHVDRVNRQLDNGLSVVGLRRVGVDAVAEIAPDANTALCRICVEWVGQAVGVLVNGILRLGVIDTCGDVCGLLPNQLEGVVCNLLCDYVGVTEFIAWVQKQDIDAIYFCEAGVKQCPMTKDAKGNVTQFVVQPPSGAQGSTFNFDIAFEITKTMGTGQSDLVVIPPAGEPIEGGQLLIGLPPALYRMDFQLKATPNQQQPFVPGAYRCEFAVCEGQCGSKNPDSYILSARQTAFNITH